MNTQACAERIRASRTRCLPSSSRPLILLAPSMAATRGCFRAVSTYPSRHENLIARMQEFRGRVYLEEGAITQEDLIDGRHQLPIDEESWHLLLLDNDDRVCGCARYREYFHHTGFSELAVSRSALAHSPEWGGRLRSAAEGELALARRFNLPFVELGGWALAEEVRGTAEALRMALATYGLGRALGGGIALSTATQRNCSTSILRRIGGRSLEYGGVELPPYYDPQFGCEMEILRFYSWAANPRYNPWIDQVVSEMRSIPVLTGGAPGPEWLAAFQGRVPGHAFAANAS